MPTAMRGPDGSRLASTATENAPRNTPRSRRAWSRIDDEAPVAAAPAQHGDARRARADAEEEKRRSEHGAGGDRVRVRGVRRERDDRHHGLGQ